MKVLATLLASIGSVAAVTIAEINGKNFLSPYNGKAVSNLTGLVTAVSETGIYLRSNKPDRSSLTSEGLYVYSKTIGKEVAVGDIISVDGTVKDYRSNANYMYLTELDAPKNVVVVSSDNKVKPLVVGVDTSKPPTKQFSKLDNGDIFAVPNNGSLLTSANPELQPRSYGMDFWQSLMGELVTIKGAYAVSRPSSYGDVWIRGNWRVTGLNKRGGLTMVGHDANPEAIIIGSPVDGSKNLDSIKLGDYVGDVTGVVSQAFGFYRILPLTAVKTVRSQKGDAPGVSFTSKGSCKGITVADYNAENLAPNSTHMPLVIDQIVNKLKTPDILFLQEVQDNSGPTNDGVVSANITLATLIDGIADASDVEYDFVEVAPVDGKDGGQPGGNIRTAFLYRPEVLELYKPNPGQAQDVQEVVAASSGPTLKYNPGRIDPSNEAWDASRKPLVAMWTVKGSKKPLFTVNVHFGSKGGSTSLHGDPRTPVNKGVEKRTEQNTIVADFVAEILKEDAKANIIVAGDFNEFTPVQPIQTFIKRSGLLDLDDVANIKDVERYSYLFDNNCEELDHIFVSKSLRKFVKFEHLHINTWADTEHEVSDHDPSVARFDMC